MTKVCRASTKKKKAEVIKLNEEKKMNFGPKPY